MILRPIEVLLVEDSPGDVWLIRQILSQGIAPKNIHVVSNGEQAIEFVRRRGSHARAPRPDLILLDLNLPRRDGLEVLREVKGDPALLAITVVVLTTSAAAFDVNSAYDLNANCYVVKPIELEAFTAAIRGIEEFWMNMALLPTLSPRSKAEPESDSENLDSAQASNGSSAASPHRRLRPYLRSGRRIHVGPCQPERKRRRL